MSNNTFMDRIRSFFGLRSEPPRNDFRNPIWGSDDDNDGDELYTRQKLDKNEDTINLQREFVKHMHEMFMNFGNMFDDLKLFFDTGDFDPIRTIADFPTSDYQTENFDSNRIRDQYLKPGYEDSLNKPMQDLDLDGKIASPDISEFLNKREEGQTLNIPFSDIIIPGRSFGTTIITTRITRPDGTVETRRIIKSGDEVIDEKTTSEQRNGIIFLPFNGSLNTDYSHLSAFLKNFY